MEPVSAPPYQRPCNRDRSCCYPHAGARGGLPDLLLWRPDKGDAKLVEVKSARDRLSDAQRAWAAALVSVGVQVEVLRVQDPVPVGGQGVSKKARGNGRSKS